MRPIAVGPPRFAEHGEILFQPDAKGWFSSKTIWFAPTYRGPILIRARKLDGNGPLAFGEQPNERERQIPPGLNATVNVEGNMRQWPGSSWVRSTGCYAWQVDGQGFSTVIVFKAVLQR